MTAVVVLGLHCGGTSAVAGVLHHLGVFMGDELLGPSYNNPKGHFEDVEFVRLHDQMIGDWKDPAPSYEIIPAYRALIEKRIAEHELWGVKDPRMMWCFPTFVHLAHSAGERVKILNVMRRPGVAAQSLYYRGGHSPFEALQISYRYHARKVEIADIWDGKYVDYLEVSYDNLVKRPYQTIVDLIGFALYPTTKFTGWYYSYSEEIKNAMDFIDPKLCHWREA